MDDINDINDNRRRKFRIILFTYYYFIFINVNILLFFYFGKDYKCELYDDSSIDITPRIWILVNFVSNLILLLLILFTAHSHIYYMNNLSFVFFYINIIYRFIFIIWTIIGYLLLSKYINKDKCSNKIIFYIDIQLPLNILSLVVIFLADSI